MTRASKVITYGVPTSQGGCASSFEAGNVRVFLEGPDTNETAYVAASLVAYWNADCEPESIFASDFASVSFLCERLVRGPVVGTLFSVGRWTPAVDDGFTWAVLDKQGAPLLLAHDAFEVAMYFSRLEEGSTSPDDGGGPYHLPTDALMVERDRADRWTGGAA